MFVPAAFVEDELAELHHVAREQAAAGGGFRQGADGAFPLILRDAHAPDQICLDELLRAAGCDGVQHLHRDGGVGLLILELARHRGDRVAVLQIRLNLGLALELRRILQQLLRFLLAEPDAGTHLHRLQAEF